MSERLVKDRSNGSGVHNSVEDRWYSMAYSLESSLLQAGAKPKEDYNVLDLYRLTQPFILENFKSDEIKFYDSAFQTWIDSK